ncbi:hypothetical protein [Lyngbya sp. PCC 8106]|uniref:hypothetical protein n=1 Tax=Lyngbya sp. (strain PCC 8106) TaxID=313612 RepID=UPI00031AF3FA|nr:hypothetical protein [Lyngbya sp. PCC 8106]
MIICPLCSGELTRHVCQHTICWLCLNCRQTLSDFLVERYNDQPANLGGVAIANVSQNSITPTTHFGHSSSKNLA